MTEGVDLPDPVAHDSSRWTEVGWGDPTHMAAFMSVLRTHSLLVDRVHAVLSDWSMSITEHAALVFLALSEGHSQPLGKIAERLLIGAPRCSYVIDRMEKRGFVKRWPHPTDGRTTLAVLTPAGLDCVTESARALNDAAYGFGSVEPALLTDLTETLTRVREIATGVEVDPARTFPSNSKASPRRPPTKKAAGGRRRTSR